MPRYKLTIEYEGTRYAGWQYQKETKSVQGELAKAILKSTGIKDFELMGSGRTDAGVHALAQVAHLEISSAMVLQKLLFSVNDELPSDIHVRTVEKARPGFHARHDAVARSYLYQIATRRSAFGKKLVWWIKDPLDLTLMQQAAQPLVGLHDFRSYASKDAESKSTKVNLEQIQLVPSGQLILVRLVASHFLHKMVRQIVGALVEVGRGNWPAGSLRKYLRTYDPAPAKVTAPPSGLFLERVYYPGDERMDEPVPVLKI